MNQSTLSDQEVKAVLDAVYLWSARSGYRGYNKHDGLNSPILRATLGWAKWPRIVAIQSVMRSPFNVRPLLLTPRTINPKGLSLFVQGLLDRYWAAGNDGFCFLEQAEDLLQCLLDARSPGDWSGSCWGYHYPWQDPGFYAPTNTPNAVVTCFVCESFLAAYRVTQKEQYLGVVESACQFLVKDLTVLKSDADELCLSYMPMPMTMRVMDVSVLIASVLSQYGALTGSAVHRTTAGRLVEYVVRQQTCDGAWFYTDPPSDSRIRHDNYHTGFILDALDRYASATGETSYADCYRRGLDFYATHLFREDGAPCWMSDQDFPHDIHGAAQGILTFARHYDDYPRLADKIASWAVRTMYDPAGRFYYQQTRRRIKRFTLLRWCNAWMAFAIARLYRSRVQRRDPIASTDATAQATS